MPFGPRRLGSFRLDTPPVKQNSNLICDGTVVPCRLNLRTSRHETCSRSSSERVLRRCSDIVDESRWRLIVPNGHLSERESTTGLRTVNQPRVRDKRPLDQRTTLATLKPHVHKDEVTVRGQRKPPTTASGTASHAPVTLPFSPSAARSARQAPHFLAAAYSSLHQLRQ